MPSLQLPLSNPSPDTRRRWAARLILLVACIGTVATAPAETPPVVSEYVGERLSLTAESPRAVRHLVIRISAKNSSNNVGADSWAALTAYSQSPIDPTRATKPSLRVRWTLEDDVSNPSETHVLQELGGDAPETFHSRPASSPYCSLDTPCEWKALLEVDLLGAIEGDVFEVDWKAVVMARTSGGDEVLQDFTIHISEP